MGTNQNSIEYRSFKKADFCCTFFDAIMENFYVTIENEGKVEELIVLSKSSADPKIWNELRNTEIISTFKTLYYSASIPYMRLKSQIKILK
jgi:hypothetical protein